MQNSLNSHITGDAVADAPGQRPRRLRNHDDGVHECVDETSRRERPQQPQSRRYVGIGAKVSEAGYEEDRDVFQIVQVGPLKRNLFNYEIL